MLRTHTFQIAKIYVPTKRAKTLDAEKVVRIAESILDVGQTTPILVREDGDRYVLVEGLHRLEALKSLGEATVEGHIVQAQKH
jgi:sulfiredoxin